MASTCGQGSKNCGVDMIGPTFRKVSSQPGITTCSVTLKRGVYYTSSTTPLCSFRSGSPFDNPWYASLGLFNTGGRLVKSVATSSGVVTWETGSGYVDVNDPTGKIFQSSITFTFLDGTTYTTNINDCHKPDSTRIFG